jgi:hypothetical protein
MQLTALHKHLKTGEEQFSIDGKPIGFRLKDFWQWSVSDLISNATRGRLAEFIVATALRIDLKEARDEWRAYDLLTLEGIKIEIKSAAYVQSWNQKKLSVITFNTKASRYWDSETNIQSKDSKRQADVYIFCLLKHADKSTINPLVLEQWEFYVLSRRDLEGYKRSKVSITLKSLQKLTSMVTYDSLKDAVFRKFNHNLEHSA